MKILTITSIILTIESKNCNIQVDFWTTTTIYIINNSYTNKLLFFQFNSNSNQIMIMITNNDYYSIDNKNRNRVFEFFAVYERKWQMYLQFIGNDTVVLICGDYCRLSLVSMQLYMLISAILLYTLSLSLSLVLALGFIDE